MLTEGRAVSRRTARKGKKSNRDRVKSYADLTPGDLVVHEHHGIGRFIGTERMEIDGAVRDYIKISFAGTDFLYVPATSLDLISKYIGGGDPEKVKLTKLGGAGKGCGKGSRGGADQALCRARAAEGLRFPARRRLAARI